uniref:Uncharacterized protein n=1 Tax=Rhizophora mucronata TaxID=61149 RepID=A0A2P2LXQ8_RHIMU
MSSCKIIQRKSMESSCIWLLVTDHDESVLRHECSLNYSVFFKSQKIK